MTPRKDISRDERGAAMIYVALFLLSSLWFVSLAIDMGKLTVTKNELQRAADAAALAGASAMDPDMMIRWGHAIYDKGDSVHWEPGK